MVTLVVLLAVSLDGLKVHRHRPIICNIHMSRHKVVDGVLFLFDLSLSIWNARSKLRPSACSHHMWPGSYMRIISNGNASLTQSGRGLLIVIEHAGLLYLVIKLLGWNIKRHLLGYRHFLGLQLKAERLSDMWKGFALTREVVLGIWRLMPFIVRTIWISPAWILRFDSLINVNIIIKVQPFSTAFPRPFASRTRRTGALWNILFNAFNLIKRWSCIIFDYNRFRLHLSNDEALILVCFLLELTDIFFLALRKSFDIYFLLRSTSTKVAFVIHWVTRSRFLIRWISNCSVLPSHLRTHSHCLRNANLWSRSYVSGVLL